MEYDLHPEDKEVWGEIVKAIREKGRCNINSKKRSRAICAIANFVNQQLLFIEVSKSAASGKSGGLLKGNYH